MLALGIPKGGSRSGRRSRVQPEGDRTPGCHRCRGRRGHGLRPGEGLRTQQAGAQAPAALDGKTRPDQPSARRWRTHFGTRHRVRTGRIEAGQTRILTSDFVIGRECTRHAADRRRSGCRPIVQQQTRPVRGALRAPSVHAARRAAFRQIARFEPARRGKARDDDPGHDDVHPNGEELHAKHRRDNNR